MSALETYPSQTRELELPSSKRLVLVTGRANPALAGKIASKLGVELGGMTLKTFTNGEVYCRFAESGRGCDMFIVQPTCGSAQTGLSANEALMERMVSAGGAVGVSAHRLI